jgi:hypothetical protein
MRYGVTPSGGGAKAPGRTSDQWSVIGPRGDAKVWRGPDERPAGRSLGMKSEPERVANGGRGGIRTPERVTPSPDFESGTINHSATLPQKMVRAAGLEPAAPSV